MSDVCSDRRIIESRRCRLSLMALINCILLNASCEQRVRLQKQLLVKKDPEVHEKFMMRLAIEEAKQAIRIRDGPPFGAAIANDKKVVCRGRNEVLKNNDPTAHAEFVAIRKACKILGTDSLEGCVLYSSCEPCPMCLSLCAMVKIRKVYYGASMEDANRAGYKKASVEFYKNLKKKDFFKKTYCKQIMGTHAGIVLRQLSQDNPIESFGANDKDVTDKNPSIVVFDTQSD